MLDVAQEGERQSQPSTLRHNAAEASNTEAVVDGPHPSYIPRIQRLQQDLLDLTIAAASLKEHIEPDPAIEIDPTDIRDRLGTLAQQFRRHQAREADLVYGALGRELGDT